MVLLYLLTSLRLQRKHHSDQQRVFILRGCCDFSFMGIDHGSGNGESETVAAGPGVSGLICPVKTVEQVWQLFTVDGVGGVVYRKFHVVSCFFKTKENLAFRSGVFHRVI